MRLRAIVQGGFVAIDDGYRRGHFGLDELKKLLGCSVLTDGPPERGST
ncbi:MAG: hypothetical protein ABI895_18315 [Deltaproteobacteria bacterium]